MPPGFLRVFMDKRQVFAYLDNEKLTFLNVGEAFRLPQTGRETRPLRCCVQHVFDKDTISGGRVVDEDMGHGANQFSCCGAR